MKQNSSVYSKQLIFNFVPVMDRELAKKVEAEDLDSKQRNADGHLKWNVEYYPPTNEEWDVILIGIRLCRHVHDFECQRCKLGCFNHCPDALGTYWDPLHKQYNPIKVCLKDYFRWCAQHGLRAWVKKALSTR